MAKINSINNKSDSLTINPATGDSYTQYDIADVGKFRAGVDDDDSDKFKISPGSALGSNDAFIMTAAGVCTKPLQPSFCAVLSSTDSDATGNNTAVSPIVFDTEIWDLNSDYDTGTGYFTAPVEGKFLFTANCTLTDIAASHEGLFFQIHTSNRYCKGWTYNNAASTGIFTSEGTTIGAVILDMDASDTAWVYIRVSGGTKVVDVVGGGSTDLITSFQGCLLV